MKNFIIALIIVLAVSSFIHAQSFDWAITSQGKLVDEGNAVCMDSEGNSYITGYFSSSSFLLGKFTLSNSSANPVNPQNSDMFVAKIDKTGKVLWAMQSNRIGQEKGIDIVCDKTGHIVVAGIFKGAKAAFGTTELTNPSSGSFSVCN